MANWHDALHAPGFAPDVATDVAADFTPEFATDKPVASAGRPGTRGAAQPTAGGAREFA
jgi:hypothetical protein